jgi:hypothetical protein
MGPKEIKGSITPCIIFRRIAGRFGMSYKSPMANGRMDTKPTNGFSSKPSAKLNYGELTEFYISKVQPKNDFSHFTGLINFQSGQMHLVALGKHEILARMNELDAGKFSLKDDWHGFTLYCTDLASGMLEVSPRSGQFGGIPIEYAPNFENYMKELFGSVTGKVLFYQSKYERNLDLDNDRDDKGTILAKHLASKHKALVPKSMSNDELKKFLPKEIASQIFTSPQG